MRVERSRQLPPTLLTTDPDRLTDQVTFWEPLDEPADVPAEQRRHREHLWHVFDADVQEVFAWARQNVPDAQSFTIHVAMVEEVGRASSLWLVVRVGERGFGELLHVLAALGGHLARVDAQHPDLSAVSELERVAVDHLARRDPLGRELGRRRNSAR